MNNFQKNKIYELYPVIYKGKGYDKKQIQLVGNKIASDYNGTLVSFSVDRNEKIILLNCVSNGNLFNKEINYDTFLKKHKKFEKSNPIFLVYNNMPFKKSEVEEILLLIADKKHEILIEFKTIQNSNVILYKTMNKNCVIIRNSMNYQKFYDTYKKITINRKI